MPTKTIPDTCFRVADLARELNIEPPQARDRLRKAQKEGKPVPECEKGPHVFNAPWVFQNKYKAKVAKLIQAQGVTKKAKIAAEDEQAAEDIAAE